MRFDWIFPSTPCMIFVVFSSSRYDLWASTLSLYQIAVGIKNLLRSICSKLKVRERERKQKNWTVFVGFTKHVSNTEYIHSTVRIKTLKWSNGETVSKVLRAFFSFVLQASSRALLFFSALIRSTPHKFRYKLRATMM